MQKFKNKVIWITGASSGIGEACAYRFAQEGATLILTALEEELLSGVQKKCLQLGATAVSILPFDLAYIEELESLANKALQQYGRIDILYNNAGISQRSTTLETDISVIRKIMNINYYAPVILTKTILPQMISNGGGQLVVTTSIAVNLVFRSVQHTVPLNMLYMVFLKRYKQNILIRIFMLR
jgi:short-subunit dehydrogenase